MAKEPKTSDSLDKGTSVVAPSLGVKTTLRELGQEMKAQIFHNAGYLAINYFTIVWLFVGACVFGLAVETVFHAIVYGGLESRSGLVWGPLSPIYGVGAVVLTLFLNRYYHSHNLVIFLISMVVGSALEYVTSWGMEFFWGAIAWDYSGTFGSLNGRTNFAFGMMWGLLGLVWVRIILPLVKRFFSYLNTKNILIRMITVGMTVFLITDIVVTVSALDREGQRAVGTPAVTWEQRFFDEHFPDSYLQSKMQNMSVYGRQ